MEQLSLESERLARAIPALKTLLAYPTLGAYFGDKTKDLPQRVFGTDRDLFLSVIGEEVARLYQDSDLADQVVAQLKEFPVLENGTHLSFFKTHDTPDGDDLRARLGQNIVISAGVCKAQGYPLHIGAYASNASLRKSSSAGYFQLGKRLFPIAKNSIFQNSFLLGLGPISKEYFNETVCLIAKLDLLGRYLATKEAVTPEEEITRKTVQDLLCPLSGKNPTYAGVENAYKNYNKKKIQALEAAFVQYQPLVKEKYGVGFVEIEQSYHELAPIFERDDLTLADQTALIQSKQINGLLEGTGITHVEIDSARVAQLFLKKALQNPDSFWYHLFSNAQDFSRFQQALSGLRSGWEETESPFNQFTYDPKKKAYGIRRLPLAAFPHTPEATLDALEKQEIIPSCVLTVLLFQSAGLVAHGGYFQSSYATTALSRFQNFLKESGAESQAQALSHLPVDLIFLSLGTEVDAKGRPLTLPEIARLPLAERQGILNRVATYSPVQALNNTAPILNLYLDENAPGYLGDPIPAVHVSTQVEASVSCQPDKPKKGENTTPFFIIKGISR